MADYYNRQMKKEKTFYQKYLCGFVLTTVAIIGLIPTAFSIVYGIIRMILTLKWLTFLQEINTWFRVVAVSIDQLEGVLSRHMLNDFMTKRVLFDPNEAPIEFEQMVTQTRIVKGEPMTKSVLCHNNGFEKLPYHIHDEDLTVSDFFGRNEMIGTLTRFGRFWAWVLNVLDKDHCFDAIGK